MNRIVKYNKYVNVALSFSNDNSRERIELKNHKKRKKRT